MDTYKRINEIKRFLFKKRFLNELADMSSIGLDNADDSSNIYTYRIKQIKTIISNMDENDKDGITKMLDEIEKHMYKKPWNKLNNIHKTTKIQEYLDELIKDDDDRLEVLTDLVEMVNNNNLNKKTGLSG